MKIEVTQADIDNGQKAHGYGCPIALALRRVNVEFSCVGHRKLFDEKGDGWTDLPKTATAFAVAFDDAQPVKPFSFELPLEACTE